ncbi:MAG TPA: hypothetical protein VJZ32_08125 [Candidatus Bathyarchaeia archaeon]|nr:hypothetical protein [Candidatus Bathyarchaeia archaeon]
MRETTYEKYFSQNHMCEAEILSLKLYFCWHSPEAFTGRLYKLYATAQTFFVECGYDTGSIDKDETLYNTLSEGLLTVEAMMLVCTDPQTDPEFYTKLFALIHGSHRDIILEHSPIRAAETIRMLTLELQGPDLAPNLKLYENKLRERAYLHEKRDVSFAGQLKRYCKTRPTREVLVMRGAMHQFMLEKALTSQNLAFTSYLSHHNLPGDAQSAIMERMQRGEVVNRKDLLRSMVELLQYKKKGYDPKTITIAQVNEIQKELSNLSEPELEKSLTM